ncbi:MAG: hypothetical protein JSS81_17800 [Acidobacteria bacterium]|nr:hypothetical protein [Acidobacteriota bacterium]
MTITRRFVFPAALMLALAPAIFAQITIKLPKVNQPKPTPTPAATPTRPTTLNNPTSGNSNNNPTSGSTMSGAADFPKPPVATDQPVFLKNTLDVRVDTDERYWKMPQESNYTSWIPQVRFRVFYSGPPTLSYKVEYFDAAGKPWFTENVKQTARENSLNLTEISSDRPVGRFDGKATIATGTHGVKITNAANGETVFEGKFKVGKFKYGPTIAMFKNTYSFYVEQDWNLPIGYVWLASRQDWANPFLVTSMWIKGDLRLDDLEAKLFYNGAEIATTKDMGEIFAGQTRFPNHNEDKNLAQWTQYDFGWYKIRVNFGNSGKKYPQAKFLNQLPGDFVVKVFHKGVQVRETSFSVGANGFVDNGVAGRNKLGDDKIIVPVRIMGAEKYNAAAWKTDAFYGNPLTGFTAP